MLLTSLLLIPGLGDCMRPRAGLMVVGGSLNPHPPSQVGARLISHAGSLTNLAKYPASTVQILGAEKALFRYRCGVVAVMAGPWAASCDALGPHGLGCM